MVQKHSRKASDTKRLKTEYEISIRSAHSNTAVILKKRKMGLAFSYGPKITQLIGTTKDKVYRNEKSGIY